MKNDVTILLISIQTRLDVSIIASYSLQWIKKTKGWFLASFDHGSHYKTIRKIHRSLNFNDSTQKQRKNTLQLNR